MNGPTDEPDADEGIGNPDPPFGPGPDDEGIGNLRDGDPKPDRTQRLPPRIELGNESDEPKDVGIHSG
jgi:hypothetical protein